MQLSVRIMGFPLPELLLPTQNLSSVPCVIAGIAGILVIVTRLSRGPNLDAIPTVGSSSWLGSWWAGFKYLTNAVDVIQEGYKKHKTAPFKIADRFHWTVVVSSREHVEELVRAPEEELSFVEGASDRLNTRYTLGDDIHDWPYHVAVIRTHLTRNIATLYPDIRDEIIAAFDELLDLTGGEWKGVQASSLVQRVVCRTTNRLFVGLPLCRDPDWIDLNIRYTFDIGKAGTLLGLVPKFLRPVAVPLFTGVTQGAARGLKHLGPIIERRLSDLEDGNEGVERPNDLLSWLMEEANGPSLTPESLAARMLFVNVTAIHTSSNGLTHALFYLAEYPQYVQPLREEVETIVEKEGWSVASLNRMRKLDSFLKECQRLKGMSALAVMRKAMKDYTFSDGTFIPKGTLVSVATQCLHHEEKFYENPSVFQPFRFAGTHGEDEDEATGRLVSTSMEYLLFGHGKHACPGRFFAANELKSMLAHVIVTYDIKLEDNASPCSLRFGTSILADPGARILFRKRDT